MYLLSNHEATVKSVSEALWSLSVPESATKTTRYYCGWIIHPTTGEAVLNIPNKALYIHPGCNINALDDFLTPLVTTEELDRVHHILKTSRSGGSDPGSEDYIPANRLNFLDFLPQSLNSLIRTKDELELAGWFPSFDEEQF